MFFQYFPVSWGSLFNHIARKLGLYLACFIVLSYLLLFPYLQPLPSDGGTEKENKSNMSLPLLPWGCLGTGTSEDRDKGERDESPVLTDRSSLSPPPVRTRGLPLELSPFVIPWLRDVGGKPMVNSAFCSLLLFAFQHPEITASWILSVQYLKPWDNGQRSPVENRQERGQRIEPWGTPTLSHWQDEEGYGKKGKNRILWYAGYQVKKVTQRTRNHGRIPKLLTGQVRYLSENKNWT